MSLLRACIYWASGTITGRYVAGFLVALIGALLLAVIEGEAIAVYCPDWQGWWCYFGFCC